MKSSSMEKLRNSSLMMTEANPLVVVDFSGNKLTIYKDNRGDSRIIFFNNLRKTDN